MSNELDVQVAALAATQHAVFSRAQALELGASAKAIRRRLESGRWVRSQPSVYRIAGAPPTWLGEVAAACLARPGSLVSHESAAVLHRMRYVPRGTVSIIAHRDARSLPGVVVHRPWRRFPQLAERIHGLAVTDRASTLIDLAVVLDATRYERVLDDQLASRQLALADVVAAFERQARRGKPGIALARRLIEERLDGRAVAESELEHRFRELIEPQLRVRPAYQFTPSWRTEGIGRVDVAFPAHQLIAELDGRRWHLRAEDFDRDRRRDQEALAHGWRTVRYTYAHIVDEPRRVAANLGKILELGAQPARNGA